MRHRKRLKCSLILNLYLLSNLLLACDSGPRVVIQARDREIPIKVEIADTPAKRTLGLQYRQELPEDHGMLFVFEEEREQTFWMKDTPLSLDLLFIDHKKTIVGIVHEAVPFSTKSLTVGYPSQYVLEINGGLAYRHKITTGNTVRFEGIDLPPVE